MQQVWAEAYTLWQGGECHYLTPEEMAALNDHNTEFQGVDPIEERLQTRLDWGAPVGTWTHKSATEVLIALGIINPSKSDATRAGMTIRKLNGGRSKRTSLCTLHLVPPPVYASADMDRPF